MARQDTTTDRAEELARRSGGRQAPGAAAQGAQGDLVVDRGFLLMGRRLLQLVIAVMVFAVPVLVAAAPARADSAGTVLGLVNSLRAAHGVGPLSADGNLTSVAQGWSAQMAAANVLSHNPNLAAQAGGGWTKVGENVGEGGDITAIFNALVNSAFHLQNMLDPSYNLTGVAVAVGAGGTLWVTQDFEAKPAAAPAPTPTPAPAPAPTPAPAPAPAPAPVVTAPPATAPPTTDPPTTAPPTTAPPTTAPPTTAPPSTDATPATPETSTTPAPRAGTPAPGTPGRLTQAASLTTHTSGQGPASGLVLTMAGLALAALTGTTFLVRRILQKTAGA